MVVEVVVVVVAVVGCGGSTAHGGRRGAREENKQAKKREAFGLQLCGNWRDATTDRVEGAKRVGQSSAIQ